MCRERPMNEKIANKIEGKQNKTKKKELKRRILVRAPRKIFHCYQNYLDCKILRFPTFKCFEQTKSRFNQYDEKKLLTKHVF